jgi:hypothetical protein
MPPPPSTVTAVALLFKNGAGHSSAVESRREVLSSVRLAVAGQRLLGLPSSPLLRPHEPPVRDIAAATVVRGGIHTRRPVFLSQLSLLDTGTLEHWNTGTLANAAPICWNTNVPAQKGSGLVSEGN